MPLSPYGKKGNKEEYFGSWNSLAAWTKYLCRIKNM